MLRFLQQIVKVFDVAADQLFPFARQTACACFKVPIEVEKEVRIVVAELMVGFHFTPGAGKSVKKLNQTQGRGNGAKDISARHAITLNHSLDINHDLSWQLVLVM